MDHRLRHLDGLRGLVTFDFAFFSGLAEHSRLGWDVVASGLPFTSATLGDLSVCVFFVLSGYVLARSFSRTSLGLPALVAKRYVRLGVPILAVVLLSWALLSTGAMENHAVASLTRSSWLGNQGVKSPDLWSALRDGFYGALLLGHSRYDSSLWTMPIEFQGSLVLIFAFSGCRWLFGAGAHRDRWCGALLLLFAAVMHGSLLFLFGIGAAACLFDLRRHTEPFCRRPWIAVALIFLGLLLGTIPFSAARPEILTRLVALAPIHYALPWRRMDPESFWHAIGAVLLLIAVDANPKLRAWFTRPPLQFLGEISFPLYLVHVPLLLSVGCVSYLWLLDAHLPVPAATLMAVAAGWIVILASAVLLSRTVERLAIGSSAVVGARIQVWAAQRRSRLLRVDVTS